MMSSLLSLLLSCAKACPASFDSVKSSSLDSLFSKCGCHAASICVCHCTDVRGLSRKRACVQMGGMVGGLGVVHYIVFKLRERWGLFKTKVPLVMLPVLTLFSCWLLA